MRSTFSRVVAVGPHTQIRRRLNRLSQKPVRVLIGVLILSLVLASLPMSADATRGLPHSSQPDATQTSVYNTVTQTLASIGGWLTAHLTAKPRRSSYQPIAAYYTPPFIDAPLDLTVTATATNSIQLSWTAVSGAHHYEIQRSNTIAGPFLSIGTTTATTYPDGSVTTLHAYLYRVRAVTSGGLTSTPSNMALGTATAFEFSSLSGQTIKAQHFYDVRNATNAVRAVANRPAINWSPRENLSGLEVMANDVQQIRNALDDALGVLNIPVTAYEDATLATGSTGTFIRAIHIEQLQTRSTRGKSTSSGPIDEDSSTARLDPMNETGGGGENPLSRNFNWNLPLVNLPGRSGLDLSLTLSYNSLVWTKIGSNSISFDNDHGFPGPGFHLGFPIIQPLYYNSEVGTDAYLLIGNDGTRTELRRVGTSGLFESADSSHLLLDTTLTLPAPDTGKFVLRTTDGAKMWFELKGGDYQCTQIKDRNGNYLTINYTSFGRIDTIVDTLERQIKFNYDGSNYLTSITQSWTINGQAQTHNWAVFTYRNPNLTIQTNFSNLTVLGPSSIKVLEKITLADGSFYKFDYTSWGQVSTISNFAIDGETLLNYRSYNLPVDSSTLAYDCPRFTERHDWAAYWNGDTDASASTSEEAVTTYAEPWTENWTMPDQTAASGTVAQVGQKLNATTYVSYDKIYFIGTAGDSTTGWQRSLPALVRTYNETNQLQRQVMTKWVQDSNASYILNPRVEEANIYDSANNHKRTSITYQTATIATGITCRLPQDISEYQANASTVLRRSHTEYQLSTAYKDRWIIGLPLEKTLYEVDPNTLAESLISKVSFQYDEDESVQGLAAPVQHDNMYYGSSVVSGRGNVSSIKRYDVSATNQFTTTTTKYNAAGSLISTTDPATHTDIISYADSFSDNGTRNTLAYPTTVTNAGGFSSSVQYNFDFGGVTWKQTPLPNETTNTPGPQLTNEYDTVGRLTKSSNNFNHAYTKYLYGPNYVETWSTINTVADEAHGLQVFDGAGRLLGNAMNHPGSSGGFSATRLGYDIVGRVIQESNPTETTVSVNGDPINPALWVATGDDATANGGFGWIFNQQTYDWKGRPLVKTNADGSTKSVSYSVCGCAGSEVVTLTDEGTGIGSPGNSIIKKRQQKIYHDVLGRVTKTEMMNWDGTGPNGTAPNNTIYRSTVSTYNARDQIKRVRQYAGAEGSGTFQETTMTYDGYGRLNTKHLPEQQIDPNNSASTDHTTWEYNSDDTIQKITDARGAVSSFLYNSRHSVTEISYSLLEGVPTSGASKVVTTGTTNFAYDIAGNRTSMTDASGSTTYVYDSLSQITSETHTFTGLSGSYTLGYEYQLSGQLKSITDHANTKINYGFDTVGRLSSVTGSGNLVAGVSDYTSGLVYRAWGGLKEVADGSSKTAHVLYNNQMQPIHFDVSGGVASQDYEYYNDGQVKYVHNNTNNKFDRSFSYDHVGRVTAAASGGEARNDTLATPMMETFRYNAFGHTEERLTETWGAFFYDLGTYVNGRRNGWNYDADGRIAAIDDRSYTYDAAGRGRSVDGQQWTLSGTAIPTNTSSDYDGDGRRVREIQTSNGWVATTYYLRSTVLRGATIEELNASGQKELGYVYTPDGSMIARQAPGQNYVMLKQLSPIGASQYEFFKSNSTTGFDASYEFDPLGVEIPHSGAHLRPGGHTGDMSGVTGGSSDSRFGAIENPAGGCVGWVMLDGLPTPCDLARNADSLQVKKGDKKFDVERFGDSVWVDAWEDYFIDGKGSLGTDENGNEKYDAGTTGTRNVGYFITIAGEGPPSGTLNLRKQIPTLSGKRLEVFEKAYNLAWSALSSTECAEEITGDGSRMADNYAQFVLSSIFNAKNFRDGGPPPGTELASTHNPGDQRKAVIKIYDEFFEPYPLENRALAAGATTKPDNPVYQSLGLPTISPTVVMAMTILHELRHAITGKTHKGESDKQKNAWEKRIFESCFPQLQIKKKP